MAATNTEVNYAGAIRYGETQEQYQVRKDKTKSFAGTQTKAETDEEYAERVDAANLAHTERESGFFRGAGGGVHEFDLPLSEEFQNQVAAGRLVRVNADGSTFVTQVTEGSEVTTGSTVTPSTEDDEIMILAGGKPDRPSDNAALPTWKTYAVQAKGGDPVKVEGMTKPELIKAYG